MAIVGASAAASIATFVAAIIMRAHGGSSACRWRPALSSASRRHGPRHGTAIANANMALQSQDRSLLSRRPMDRLPLTFSRAEINAPRPLAWRFPSELGVLLRIGDHAPVL